MQAANSAEREELEAVLGTRVADLLCSAPGGWRTLAEVELEGLGLPLEVRASVRALQGLTGRGYPALPLGRASGPERVGQVYAARLGAEVTEHLFALALDGRRRLLAEIEIARGGAHAAAVTPGDVFRPLIRAGAMACILVHNHPSGDPTPSREDVAMTGAVQEIGNVVGIPLLDHIVVGARGGGWRSMLTLGLVEHAQEGRHGRAAE